MSTHHHNKSNKKRNETCCLRDVSGYDIVNGCALDSDSCFLESEGCNLDADSCFLAPDFDSCTSLLFLPFRWIVIGGLMLYGDWDYQGWTLKS